MPQDYSVLFQPIRIGKLEIKNRLSVPPMGTGFAAEGGGVSDRLLRYHELRAKGGFGLIIVEISAVDGETGLGSDHALCIHDDRFIPGFRRLAETVHKYGAKLGVQIYHPGRSTFARFNGGREPVAPSAIPEPVQHQPCRALSVDEIKEMVERFARAALRVKQAGCDAVEFHGAHGYLISEFMSAYANKRIDEYGGGFEGFVRFPQEIVRRSRELVGPDFPLLFRISGEEMVAEGRDTAGSVQMMKRLVEAGIDAVDVSIGVMESGHYTSAPADMPEGFNARTSAEFKKALKVPVLVAGRIHDPSVALDIVASGKADMVHIGRQSLTDPDWPAKVKEGRTQDIVRCISCNEACIEGIAFWLRPSITCVQNLMLGREEQYLQPPVASPKTVLVAGGGPAGLEAARTAALRGHRVILFEKDGYLGGQTKLASIPPAKDIYCEVATSRIQAVRSLGVEICVGQRLTPGMVRQIKPDVLIVATGSEPAIPNIAGANGKNVMSARKALCSEEVGENVLVIGGGLVGCETADYLAGKGKHVTVVEMLKRTAREIGPAARFFLRNRLREKRVNLLTLTTVKAIMPGSAVVESPEGEHTIGPFDTFVLAVGAVPVNDLAEQLKGEVPEIFVIGDADKPGKILAAVEKGAEIALSL